jgi:chaperonin GroEL
MLEDIAVITGGQVVIDESDSLEELEIYSETLGSAKQVIITKDSTQIVSGYGQIDEVMSRLALIKNQISDATSEYDKERLGKWLTNLSRSMSELKG